MTRLVFAAALLEDLDRIIAHLLDHEVPDVDERIGAILRTAEILKHSPEIGRPAPAGKRDLVIGTRQRAYVLRYRYDAINDEVRLLAVRAQREAGFRRGGRSRS